jgi:hypothetical protein
MQSLDLFHLFHGLHDFNQMPARKSSTFNLLPGHIRPALLRRIAKASNRVLIWKIHTYYIYGPLVG